MFVFIYYRSFSFSLSRWLHSSPTHMHHRDFPTNPKSTRPHSPRQQQPTNHTHHHNKNQPTPQQLHKKKKDLLKARVVAEAAIRQAEEKNVGLQMLRFGQVVKHGKRW
jgi:hypothetical protein